MANVTGWSQLINGSLVESGYAMYNASVNGNFLLVMFTVLTATLYLKTYNPVLCFIVGLIFFGMFYSMLTPIGITFVTCILVLELAISLYKVFWST
jgi:hypothetical protein